MVAEFIALLGTSASNGKILQSSVNSAISWSKKTDRQNSSRACYGICGRKSWENKATLPIICWKTNSEICAIVKKQLKLTKSKLLQKSNEKTLKDLTSSLQLNKKIKIKYLD